MDLSMNYLVFRTRYYKALALKAQLHWYHNTLGGHRLDKPRADAHTLSLFLVPPPLAVDYE